MLNFMGCYVYTETDNGVVQLGSLLQRYSFLKMTLSGWVAVTKQMAALSYFLLL
jgi:hypothetical protein